MAGDAYITFCKALIKAEDGHPQGPIELTSELKALAGTAVQSSAAPAGTMFAVVTMRATDGVVRVGSNPTAVDGDRFLADRIPTVVRCVQGEKISCLDIT